MLGALDAAHDRVVTFGGSDLADVANHDTWSFELAGLPRWTRSGGLGLVPDEVREACVTVDTTRARIVVHGGGRPDSLDASYIANETRTLSLAPEPAWGRIAPPAPAPTPRYGQGSAYDALHDAFWIFGGRTSQDGAFAFSDELWRADLAAPGTWTRLGNTGPEKRHEPSLGYDARTNALWLFGGWNDGDGAGDRYFGDTWTAEVEPFAWTHLAVTGPKPRRAQATAWDASRRALFVFGGQDADSSFNDAWELSTVGTPSWRRLDATGEAPAPRAWATAIHDAAHDRMIVYGGSIGGVSQDDAWALTLSGTPHWERLTPAGAAPARTRHVAAYDGARSRMLVWGGFDSENMIVASHPGVWALSLGSAPAWTMLETTGHEPYPATSPTMVFDARRDRLVTYGGSELFDDLLPDFRALAFGGLSGAAWVTGARVEADGAHLEWQTAQAPGTAVIVEKRIDNGAAGFPGEPTDGSWFQVASGNVAADGSVEYVDARLRDGVTYSWRLVIGGVPTGEVALTSPVVPRFAFAAAFPIPARGALTLALRSTGAELVRAALYDAGGRRVHEESLGVVPAGWQNVAFAVPEGLRSGVYFLRVSQGAAQATRKIVLL
jgi:hypothetical protein